MILIMQEAEGSLRCNDCHGEFLEDETPDEHAERVHDGDDVYVVHPDDHDPYAGGIPDD
jgi:hypothetical protein